MKHVMNKGRRTLLPAVPMGLRASGALAALALLVIGTGAGARTDARTSARPRTAARSGAEESLVALLGNRPLAGSEIATEGNARRSRILRMQIDLAPRDEAELDRLLDDLQDPDSPDYQNWLSADGYNRRFAPARQDVEEITRWLRTQGFTVTHASADEARVVFEGTVATVQRAFRVRIAGSRDGKYYGNVTDPRLPASWVRKVSHISGLHNMSGTVYHTKITDSNNNSNVQGPHFGPPDVWTYANEHPLLDAGMDGSGQCIALLEGSDVDQASLTDFNTVFSLPPFVAGQNYNVVYPDGPPGIEPPINNGTAQAYSEATIDIEWAHGIAPGAEVVLYAGAYPTLRTQGLVNTLIAATTDNRCGTIAISWAQCGEPKSFYKMLDSKYKRGVAQGQTIFVATGDVGVGAPTLFNRRTGGCRTPSKPTIEENAGSPNVTAVGATQIRSALYDANGVETGIGNPAEEVWNFDAAHVIRGSSTGGESAIFKKPKYQKGITSVKFKKRGVPDICLGGGFPAAGYWECLDFGLYQHGVQDHPSCAIGGGTSLVPEQWAAIIAILTQKKGDRWGNINPRLYDLAKANIGNLDAIGIRDVTQGNNSWYPLTGYNAAPGYDLASGWGSVDIAQFVDAFLNFVPPVRP